MLFLGIVELPATTAEVINTELLNNSKQTWLSRHYILNEQLVCFARDGA